MAFIEKLDDKVTKWQSSKRANLLIYSYFVNFATLPLQSFFHYVGCHPIPARYRVNVGGTSREYRGHPRPLPVLSGYHALTSTDHPHSLIL